MTGKFAHSLFVTTASAWLSVCATSVDAAPPRGATATVAHFQDRSPTDEYIWLEAGLAESLRSLLATAGYEVVDYGHLDALGIEQAITRTGLPTTKSRRNVRVAAAEVSFSGEYSVHGNTMELVISAAQIDPPAVLARVKREGPLHQANTLLTDATLELTSQMQTGRPADALSKIRSIELPSFKFQRWYYEGRMYSELRRHAEAWYCFRRATDTNPKNFRARLHENRSLRALGLADHAALELEELYRTGGFYAAQNPGSLISLQSAPQIERLLRKQTGYALALNEVLQTLDEARSNMFSEQSPLDWHVLSRMADLYTSPAAYWENQTYTLTPAVESILEEVQPHYYDLILRSKMARYWHTKGRAEQALHDFQQALESWKAMAQILGPARVTPDIAAEIAAVFAEERARLQQPYVPHAVSIEYTPPRLKQRSRPLPPLSDGTHWSDDCSYDWPKEFEAYRVLRDHDGGMLALGTVKWCSEQEYDVGDGRRKQMRRSWAAYTRSSDGKSWSEPVLFPSPINEPPGPKHLNRVYPIIVPLSDGSYAGAWPVRTPAPKLTFAEARILPFSDSPRVVEDQVYVARSKDLQHWSAPTQVPAQGSFDIAELPDGSVLIVSHNTGITRSFDLLEWSPPRKAATGIPLWSPGDGIVIDSRATPYNPRIIVADDGLIHIVAVVELGAIPSKTTGRVLVHLVSENTETWTLSLVQPDSWVCPFGLSEPQVAAIAAPERGLLLFERRETDIPVDSGRSRLEIQYGAYYTTDGVNWRQGMPYDLPQAYRHLPSWGGLWRNDRNEIEFCISRNRRDAGFRKVVVRPDRLLAGTPFEATGGDTFWREPDNSAADSATTIIIDAPPGESPNDRFTRSVGLLTGRDLHCLERVRTFMSDDLWMGFSITDAPSARTLSNPRVRWADYVMQICVEGNESDKKIDLRLVNVNSTRTVFETTLSGAAQELHQAQKTLSSRVAEFLGRAPKSKFDDEEFRRILVWKPSSFQRLNRVIWDDPGLEDPEWVSWVVDDPDSPVPLALGQRRTEAMSQEAFRNYSNASPHGFDHFFHFQESLPINLYDFHAGSYEGEGEQVENGYEVSQAVRLERALRTMPSCRGIRMRAVHQWITEGAAERARPHIDYLLAEYRDDPASVATCARAYEFIGDWRTTRTLWQEYLQKWGDDEHRWLYWYDDFAYGLARLTARQRLSLAHVRLADYDQAIPLLEEQLRDSQGELSDDRSDMIVLWSHYLAALVGSGQCDKAVRTAERLLDENEKQRHWHLAITIQLIRALEKCGDKNHARILLAEVLTHMEPGGAVRPWYSTYHDALLCSSKRQLVKMLEDLMLTKPLMGR